jgi:hypothetical protein
MCCTFRCSHLGCNETWVDEEAKSVSHSHGLCPKHARLALLETCQKQQRREGVPDCAGKCFGNCAQTWCTYWPVCVNDLPSRTEIIEVEKRLHAREVALYGRRRGLSHAEVMAAGQDRERRL